MQKSNINDEIYNENDCCFFRNYVQAAHYIAWGCKLVDLFVDKNMKLVFVFNKTDHEWARIKWGKNNLENGKSK